MRLDHVDLPVVVELNMDIKDMLKGYTFSDSLLAYILRQFSEADRRAEGVMMHVIGYDPNMKCSDPRQIEQYMTRARLRRPTLRETLMFGRKYPLLRKHPLLSFGTRHDSGYMPVLVLKSNGELEIEEVYGIYGDGFRSDCKFLAVAD